jgi:hypothetical protein
MAADFIKLQRDQSAATEVQELLKFIQDLRSVYERAGRIKAKMARNFNDAGGEASIDWSQMQTTWGIPVLGGNSIGPTANGAIIYNLVNGTLGSMEGTFQTADAKNLTERVG